MAAGAALLRRLCAYYLDCLAAEQPGDVSLFARSRYEPDYVELEQLPALADEDPLATDVSAAFLARAKPGKSLTYYVGHPIHAKRIQAKSGWSGFVLEPLLLYPLNRQPSILSIWPVLNPRALTSLTGLKGTALVESAMELAEEVGLDSDEPPDIEGCLSRLYAARPSWPWRGDPSAALPRDGLLKDVKSDGIYNAAILLRTERPPFTVGLERELKELRKLSDDQLAGTALAGWLSGVSEPAAPLEPGNLLQPMPLNDEQRRAVAQSLQRQVTVITGPPGTGKSQVVSSLVINAARQGTRLLFASKNNKAVDVVSDRTNAIGPRPVLLRLGKEDHQTRIAEFLSGLLGHAISDDEEKSLERVEADAASTSAELEAVNRNLVRTIDHRNRTDLLEQDAEIFRSTLSAPIRDLERMDATAVTAAADVLAEAVRRADRQDQSPIVRSLWRLLRRRRFEACDEALAEMPGSVRSLGWERPRGHFAEERLALWKRSVVELENAISGLEAVQAYLSSLKQLQEADAPEVLARRAAHLQAQMVAESESLWNLWLKVQPSRLTLAEKSLLGDYMAVVQLLSGRSAGKAYGELMRQFNRLFPKVVNILPCWGITSLSVRNRVPFSPGFFDLVVIDEASQCDIASALPLLYRAKRVVVIGHPMQLRHVTSISTQQDTKLLDRHGLLESAGWSYSERSLYDRASTLVEGNAVISLRDHYRSHADIIGFSNRRFYDDRLRIVTRYSGLIEGDLPAVRWLDVSGDTQRPSGGSARNRREADAVVDELVRLVLDHRYQGSIGVVTPFRAQVNLIRDRIRSNRDLDRALGAREFLVATADGFQGDEKDIVLFSPVVSGSAHQGAISFLAHNANRFNVAMSRARAALAIIGDRNFALTARVPLLRDLADYVEHVESRSVKPVVDDLGPKYPRLSGGAVASDWEHVLYEALYATGIATIPQLEVDQYYLDLALIAKDRKLDIEVDGEHYHRAWDGDVSVRDRLRTQRLVELGWDVMRFWVYEVRDDLQACIDRVTQWIAAGESGDGNIHVKDPDGLRQIADPWA